MGRYALAVRARELRRARPVSTSRTTRSATSAVMSAEPTPVGITSTTSAADEVDARGDLAHRPEEVDRRHAARLRRPGARRERRVEHVDVDRQVDRPLPDVRERSLDDLADAEVADVVHEERRDPALALPLELGRPRPVAAQADLRVARAGDRAPPRRGGTSASRASARRRTPRGPCRCACRSGSARSARAARATADAHGSVIEWSPPSVTGITPASTTSPTSVSIAACERAGSAGMHRRVAVVDDAQLGERIDPRLEVRARAGTTRRGSRAARTACPAGPRRGRRSARRRSRRRRPRGAPAPARCGAPPNERKPA